MRYWASSEGRPAARLRRGCRVRAAPAQWRRSRELIMKIGPLPDACRTSWIRGFTASERTGSGVSWRSGWPGAPGPRCWWFRCVLSPVFWAKIADMSGPAWGIARTTGGVGRLL